MDSRGAPRCRSSSCYSSMLEAARPSQNLQKQPSRPHSVIKPAANKRGQETEIKKKGRPDEETRTPDYSEHNRQSNTQRAKHTFSNKYLEHDDDTKTRPFPRYDSRLANRKVRDLARPANVSWRSVNCFGSCGYKMHHDQIMGIVEYHCFVSWG